MKLLELLQYVHGIVPSEFKDVTIHSIENDHRQITNGSLFICIKGYTVDGHDFARAALENGAVAVVSERHLDLPVPVIVVKDTKRAMAVLADTFYGQPSHHLQMIGITGTNGKTTTSHLVEKIFHDAGVKTGLIGTMYTKIGKKKQETKNTTPESLTLQKLLHEMVNEHVKTTVMEVSSHALHLGRVHGVDFQIALFTNLSQDHLDYHETMEAYAQAKGLLFSQLGNSFHLKKPKFAIFNEDDPISMVYKNMTAANIMTFGINHQADVMAKNLQITAKGTDFDLITPFGTESVSIQMAGEFSVYNVLAAVSVAIASGLDVNDIIKSIESVKGVAGRFELVDEGQDFTVIIDYAHTPDGLENVLKTVQQFAERRVFVVVGCGGDRDKTKRPLMASIACKYGTDAIFTSDNPRSEDPHAILREMEDGVVGKKYQSIPDRKEAIAFAVNQASAGDVILIAGKGHETYQIIGDKVFDFDDRLVAKEAIKGRS